MTEALLVRRQDSAYVVLAVSVVLLSLGPVFVRFAQAEGLPSLGIAFIRHAVAALILTPYVLSRKQAELRQLSRREIRLLVLAGALLACGLTLTFVALEHTTVLIANVFANSAPLWVAVMEVLILGAVLGRRVWMGLLLALAGTVAFTLAGAEGLNSMGDNPLLGGGLALLGALAASLYLIVGRAVRSRISTVVFMWIVLLSGSVSILIVMLVGGTPLLGYPLEGYLWALVVTVTGQLLGQSLLAYCLAHLPATLISMATQVVVVLGAALAFFIFHERPGPLQIVASTVILAGVILSISRSSPQMDHD